MRDYKEAFKEIYTKIRSSYFNNLGEQTMNSKQNTPDNSASQHVQPTQLDWESMRKEALKIVMSEVQRYKAATGSSDAFVDLMDVASMMFLKQYDEVILKQRQKTQTIGIEFDSESCFEIVERIRKIDEKKFDFSNFLSYLEDYIILTSRQGQYVDYLGDIYELEVANTNDLQSIGQFLTPSDVCNVIAQLSNALDKDNDNKPATIYEPCCGTGRLAFARFNCVPHTRFLRTGSMMYLEDLDERSLKLLRFNLLCSVIYGQIVVPEHLQVSCVNTITREHFKTLISIRSVFPQHLIEKVNVDFEGKVFFGNILVQREVSNGLKARKYSKEFESLMDFKRLVWAK